MADDQQPSFLSRALLAFVFVWSFRVIVLALAVGWATLPSWLPEATPAALRTGAYVFTCATALWTVRALLVIRDTWQPLAPPLGPDDHPELQALVADVAEALDTEGPDQVFLMPDANSWVRETRRWLGLKTERTVVLGYVLLCTSTVSELRATVAHELAHFVGGDTRFAPSVARTRQGMLMLLQELHGGFFFRPVVFYAAFFLTLTQSMSRAQEMWADRASVRVAGRGPHQESLRDAVVADVLLRRMIDRGLSFLVACGYRPDNVFGWLRRAADAPSAPARREIEDELRTKPAEAFDSHPPPAERIVKAAEMPEPEGVTQDDRPATALLRGDMDEIEREQTRLLLRALQVADDLPVLAADDELVTRAALPTIDRAADDARERAGQLFGEDAGRDDEAALRALLAMAARSDESADAPADQRAMGAAVREMVAPGIGALLARVERGRGGELVFDGVERPRVVRGDEELWPFDEAADAVVDAAVATRLLARLDG